MALISPNARYQVKVKRDILVEGVHKATGDVVEVDLATKNKLLAMGVAVEHAAEKFADKFADKAKGK